MLVLLFLAKLAFSREVCEFESGTFYNASDLKSCFDTFPDNTTSTEFTNLTSLILEYLDSYVFVDQMRNPPSPYENLYKDLKSEIKNLSFGANETGYEFYMRIVSIFKELRDPHTLFVPPCLSNFYWLLPYAFTVVAPTTTDGNYTVKAISSHSHNITNYYIETLNKTNIIGKTVTQIKNDDGDYEDALTYISEWADGNSYISKSQHARFNRVLNMDFHARVCSQYEYPGTTFSIKYLDDNSEEQELDLDVFGYASTSISSMDDYCYKWEDSSSSVAAMKRAVQNKEDSRESPALKAQREFQEQIATPLGWKMSTAEAEAEWAVMNAHAPKTPRDVSLLLNASSLILVEEVSGEIVSYYVEKEKLGYLRIYTFSPSDIDTWVKAVFNTLYAFKKTYEAEKLVIDVRANGGGYVHLGMQLHHFLFPSEYPIYGVYQLRTSDLNAELVKIPDDDGVNTFFDPVTDEEFEGTSYYDRQQTSLFNDATTNVSFSANYTQPFRMVMDDPDVFKSYLRSWSDYPGYDGTALWKPSNIVVVTDGLCGSTCCCFIKHTYETRSARIIGFGHDPHTNDTSYDSGSFCGGTVYSSTTVQGYKNNDTILALINETVLPANFSRNTMKLGWARHQIHTWDLPAVYTNTESITTGETLLEFKVDQVHDREDNFFPQYTFDRTKDGMASIITYSLSYFDHCYDFEVADDSNACPTANSTDTTTYGGDHKIFGHPCINGHFAYDLCVFSRCEDGYYLNGSYLDGNRTAVKCVASPHLFSRSSGSESSDNNTTTKILIFVAVLVALVIIFGAYYLFLQFRERKNAAGNQHSDSEYGAV